MNYEIFQYSILLCYFTVGITPTCRQGPYANICGYNGSEYSASEVEDKEIICDCQMVIFCSVISFTTQCNCTTIHLELTGNAALSTQLSCNILPLESQALIPTLAVLNNSGNELSVEVFADSLFGKYRVFCSAPEVLDEINKTSSSNWEIVGLNPEEVLVDSEVKLQLKLNKDDNSPSNSTPAWCFVNTPDNDTEILSVVLISEGKITCTSFSPIIPGEFRVSLTYRSPAYTFEKSISMKVTAKRPTAQKAEYDFDFKTMFIYFDANIELHSTCNDIFPKPFQEYFGSGFECYIKGNMLGVKMGSQFKIVNNITVGSDNKICREGYHYSGFCLSVLPVNLIISKPKVLGPKLSFYMTNACTDDKTQKYLSVRVFGSDGQAVSPQSQILSAGKTQRKNLMMWRSMRQIQSKLSSHLALQVNKTDIIPLYENLWTFDSVLDVDDSNLGSAASVSVYVSSSPSSSSLLAEAHGWSTAEVLENAEEVLIVPSELAIGTADDIFLHAVTRYGNSVSWTCRMAVGEPCFMRNQKLVSDMFDFTSSNISLPAGSLPVGDYIWTVESSGETKQVQVFIKPGELTVSVGIPLGFVNPSLGVVLKGSIQGVKEPCHAGWSSVRQKGFRYLDLHIVGGKEILVDEHLREAQIPLAIPPSSALLADSLYLFKFQVFCPRSGSLRYIKVPVRTGTPPVVFPVTVEPLAGKAMITNFRISGAETDVSIHDYPVVFEWSYIDPCGAEIALGRGLSARNFTTYLPPGLVKIMVRVCDGRKICSTSVSPTIAVIQAAEIRAENFEKSLNQVQYLMASGEVREAFGLAVTMFKSLVLVAEFEIRKKVFATVEKAINLRIKDLTEKLRHDPRAVRSSLEFYEQTETVTKYFRSNSAVLMRLKDFRNNITNHLKSN